MKNNLPLSLSTLLVLNLIFAFRNADAQSYSIYGVTQSGGNYNDGVIYRYSYPSGNDTVILNFNDTNGTFPKGYLIVASDGNLYGTTTEGGTSNDGVFFCFNPITYKDTVLINFNGANGSDPQGGVFQANNGLIYGLTLKGGTHGLGICFQYDIATKTETPLFSFDGSNGSKPNGGFIQASNDFLIGHTTHGGTYGDGVLFYYNINTGHDSVLVNFNASTGYPPKGLLQATNRLIYGTTTDGADSNYGSIYSYNLATRTFNFLQNFSLHYGTNPASDESSLFQSYSGLLYGITEFGGTDNKGVLYSYDINTATDSVLVNFSSPYSFGKEPSASGYIQIQAYGNLLFASIDSGGTYNMGTLIAYNPTNGNFTKLLDFNDTNGAYPANNLVAIENQAEGISVIRNNNITSLYPNPNNGVFTIHASNVIGQSLVEIYNMLGEKIFMETLPFAKGNNNINLGTQSPGIYLYRLTSLDGSEVSTGKFIVK